MNWTFNAFLTFFDILASCPPQVFKQPWPGVMRTVYGNHQRFETTYFQKFPGYYVTGDGKIRLTWS